MKKIISIIAVLSIYGTVIAQTSDSLQIKQAQRKFQILVKNEEKIQTVQESNKKIAAMQTTSRNAAQRGLFGDLLWTGYTSSFTQKTVNATSNLISLGINYLTKAIKGEREEWYNAALKQCYYNQKLTAESKIDDFYYCPSTKGAMDPANLKFEGFGCKNYIELIDSPGQGTSVFYVFCKIRRDDEGIRHIVNHSKFLVELDTLIVNPRYCNLPNDSTGSVDSRFNFDKRDSLNLQLKVRLYSSWINQATMIFDEKLLGEFIINVFIDKNKLNSNGLFIYNKNDPDYQQLVSVVGDSFIVPRSFTGTTDATNYMPIWGTGQYRVEMEIFESCKIVDSYYLIRESGNGKAVAFADATPGKKKWDKEKWKAEWKSMKVRKSSTPFLNNVWNCIVSGYKGSCWIATLTDPFTTALYGYETQKLDNWADDLHEQLFSSEP